VAKNSWKYHAKKIQNEKGSVLLETILVLPIILLFLAGFLALTDLVITKVHLTHAARIAAREYIFHQDISHSRSLMHAAIAAGGCPLETSRLSLSTGNAPLPFLDKNKDRGFIQAFIGAIATNSIGTRITIGYKWGGARVFGLTISPFYLTQDCTVLAGSWKI